MTPVEIPMPRLADWTGGDPAVRAESAATVDHPAIGLRDGDRWAVVFVRPTHTHGVSLMLRGDDAVLRELVGSPPFASWSGEARSKGADRVTLPRTAEDLGLIDGTISRWEFMTTTRVVPARPVAGLADLEPRERDEVQALLDEHNPGTDGRPFADPAQRWVGVRGEDDRLLAVGCCELERSGAPVLTGITVTPAARGLRLGRAVTAELTRTAVEDHGWCTLGMYSHNERARGIYLSLGYDIDAEWSSGRLA